MISADDVVTASFDDEAAAPDPSIEVAATTEVVEDTPAAPAWHEPDPEVLAAICRAAAEVEAGRPLLVGEVVEVHREDAVAVTMSFAATDPGYRGWRWSVTAAVIDGDVPTVSEVVLLPGPDALIAPAWVPWEERIRPGDLGPGDLLPPLPDDPRVVPAYLESDDPAVEDVAHELGVGRARVLSRAGRDDAAERWHDGAFGPDTDMARQAPGVCAACAFYLPLAGSLGEVFGVCANEMSPGEGHVVDVAFGCGAHSETVLDLPSRAATGSHVVDELRLEVHRRPDPVEPAGEIVDVDTEPAGLETAAELVEVEPTTELVDIEPIEELLDVEPAAVQPAETAPDGRAD